MGLFARITVLFILVAVLAGGAFACSVATSGMQTLVRGNSDYATNISAGKNQDIDIKIQFSVDNFSGNDCPSNISAQAQVSRYNNDTGNWESYHITSTKSQELSQDDYVFVWANEFNTGNNDTYTRYRIDGIAVSGSDTVDQDQATIDITDNSCTGINLVANDFSINQGSTSNTSLSIQNSTDQEFNISNVNVSFTNSLIDSASTADYDSLVEPFSSTNVNLSLSAGCSSDNTTVTGTYQVSGYLGNTYCSYTDIGTKSFDVTVNDNGNSSNSCFNNFNDNSGTSSDCRDIELNANDQTMSESTQAKPVVTVKNNSSRRFEILDVKTTQSGLDLSTFYKDKYVFPGQVSDVILKADSPAVTTDETFNNTVWVRGIFSDGRTCSFDNINETAFDTTVLSTSNPIQPNCGNFSIDAPSSVNIQNYGTVPFTINNGSNKRADVYVEGTVDASPSIISLPGGTSISRNITVQTTAVSGELILRPVLEGCSPVAASVLITNTAKGSINEVTMSTTSERDQNSGVLTLTVEFNNPTTKAFLGDFSISAPKGWTTVEKTITLPAGKSIYKETVTPTTGAEAGPITVSYSSEGRTITNTFNSNEGTLAGLFALGGDTASVAALLLIIIIVIIIAAVVAKREPKGPNPQQAWQRVGQ